MIKIMIPRLRDVLFIAILIGALALGPRILNTDGDLGRHLAVGRYILEEHQIPTQDLFSHTRQGDARPAYEWLTQLVFAIAEKLAGLDGPLFVTAFCIALAFMIVQTDSARRSQMPLVALVMAALAAAASSLHWLPRPHIVTFVLLAIWLERLERARTGEPIPVWQFPILMLIWANAHGGFIFGVLAWIAIFAGWVFEYRMKNTTAALGRRLMLIGTLSLVATFITPGIWGNWQAVLSNHSQFILSRTVETMPPDFSTPGTWPFVLMIAITIFIVSTTRNPLPISHYLLLAGFALLGLMMARNIPLFAISATPILSQGAKNILHQNQRWQEIEKNISALDGNPHGAFWPIMAGFGIAILFIYHFQAEKKSFARLDERFFPVAAVDWLLEHPQSGNPFNEFNWGGYLLSRLWPGQKVFLDSQTDFYGEELVREYDLALSAQGGWQKILDKYQVEWALLPPTMPLASALRLSGWKIVYEDATAVIMREP